MNLALSIFLCLAMILSGTDSLPAEPEFATTWTLRNVALKIGEDACALDPEAKLTASAGAERIDLQLALESGGEALAPIALELAPEGLRFSFGTGDRAYLLSAAGIDALAGYETDAQPLVDAASDLVSSFGTLLGGALGGRLGAMHSGIALALAAVETCGSSIEPAQLKLDGETLDGRRIALTLSPESIAALLDELRDCGAPALEEFTNSALRIVNFICETDFASFAEMRPALLPGEGFALKLEITTARNREASRCLVNGNLNQPGRNLLFRVDCATRSGDTDVDAYLYLGDAFSNYGCALVDFSGRFPRTGGAHMELDAASCYGAYSPFRSDSLRLTADCAAGDPLRDVKLSGSYQPRFGPAYAAEILWTERREVDGSVTAATSLDIDQNGERLGSLRFDLNLDNPAPEELFKDAESCPITATALLYPQHMDLNPDRSALGADRMRIGMDIRRIAQDPSVQSLIRMLRAYD